jgi:hypothetical protein
VKTCIFCGAEFTKKRRYDHCTAPDCVTMWKQERRSHMAIALLPKQGFQIVYKNDAASLPVTTKR